MTASRFTLVGIGEALYDVFPDRQVLGGAPLNLIVHAHRIATRNQGKAIVVSRVGQDDLGSGVIDEIQGRQMEAGFLQTDPDHPTGRVTVSVGPGGEPTYDIVDDVAWDWIHFDPDLEGLAHRCQAVCWGTLAQRNSESRNTILRFLDAMRPGTLRLFDINLRQNFHDARIIRRSLIAASALKVNEEELPTVGKLIGCENAGPDAMVQDLIRHFELEHVIYTRGERGTVLYDTHGKTEGAPARYEHVPNADAVGAGDACTATVMSGLLLNWPLQQIADTANRAGAYVASQQGATPELPDDVIQA